MKKTRKTISQKWNIFRLFFIRGRHCSRLHLRQRKIFQGPSWNMGHRVPPAISRYMYKYIYMHIFFFLAFTQRGRNEKKKENATSREKYMIYHVDYSKRNLFETKQRTRSHEFIRVFFFFFRCYHRGTFDVANVLSSRETYPYLNLTSCRWYFESGIFLNPQKYSFFFPDENPVFFFFPSAAEILIKQFICDGNCRRNGIGIVFQFIHISFADLLVNSIVKKKKKKQTHLV